MFIRRSSEDIRCQTVSLKGSQSVSSSEEVTREEEGHQPDAKGTFMEPGLLPGIEGWFVVAIFHGVLYNRYGNGNISSADIFNQKINLQSCLRKIEKLIHNRLIVFGVLINGLLTTLFTIPGDQLIN